MRAILLSYLSPHLKEPFLKPGKWVRGVVCYFAPSAGLILNIRGSYKYRDSGKIVQQDVPAKPSFIIMTSPPRNGTKFKAFIFLLLFLLSLLYKKSIRHICFIAPTARPMNALRERTIKEKLKRIRKRDEAEVAKGYLKSRHIVGFVD